jgi:WD40 repeat protein
MPAHQVRCPKCQAPLQSAKPLPPGSRLKCGKCGVVFQVGGAPTKPQAAAVKPPAPGKPQPAGPAPSGVARRKARPAPRGGNRAALIGAAVGGALLLFLVVVGILVGPRLFGRQETQVAQDSTQPAAPPARAAEKPAGLPQQTGNPATQPENPAPPPQPPANQEPPAQSPPQPEEAAVELVQLRPGEAAPAPVEPPPGAKPVLVLDPDGPSASVRNVLFTPDSQQVILTGLDKTARVVDVTTGETVRVFRLPLGAGDEGALHAAALSPGGKTLAVGGMPFGRGAHGILIYLISMTSGRVEKVLRGHSDIITYLDFSHDGRHLASASNDGTARIYDLAAGQTVRVLQGSRDRLRRVEWSPDDRLLATVCLDGTARIWNAASGSPVADLRPRRQGEPIMSVAWSPDGGTLATGARDGTIQLWGPDGSLRKDYTIAPGEPIQVASLAYTPNGRELLFAGVDRIGRAGIVSLDTGRRRLDFKEHDNTVLSGSVSRDGRLAVTTGGDRNETFVWKVADGQVVQKIVGRGASVFGVGWSRDGGTIAWGTVNQGNTGLQTTPVERTFRLTDFEFGEPPDDQVLRHPTGIGGSSLQQLDFTRLAIKKNGQVVHVFQAPVKGDRIYSYSVLTPDRAVVGTGFFLYLIDLRTGQVVRTYTGHSGAVFGVSPRPDGRYFLTGSQDQTLRLWDPGRDEPLLSLFIAGRDWIAWTPEGYYAASPYGERLMGWQVNNGPEQLATFHPAVQFRRSLYRPEAVKLVLKTGSIQKALELENKEKQEPPAAAVSVAQVLPPAVVITSPAGSRALKISQPRLQVKAAARSVGGHAVTAMRLLVDGRPWQGEKGVRTFAPPRPGDVQAAWAVDLAPGKHVLAVQAESAVSKGLSPPVEVTRTGKGARVPPNLYLLAVGISAYPGEMALQYAHADAEVIAEVFQKQGKGVFDHVEVKLITDRAATKRNIVSGLAWLGSKMTAQDVGIIFFAGHGTQDPLGRFYLVPVDINPRDPAGTCISGDAIKRTLENMPGKLVAMLDACHSGAVATPGLFGRRPARADNLARDLVTDDYGVVVMCSSLGREYSMESPATKHGFFTLGVVEALSGRADFNHDRVIHIHEMDFYATLRVRQLSGGRQNPVTGRPATIRSFPLTRF